MIKQIFKLVTLLVLTVSAGLTSAKTIEVVSMYKAGGGLDLRTTDLMNLVEKQGYTIKKVYFKNCYEAVNYIKGDTNRFLVSPTGDILAKTIPNSNCPSIEQEPTLRYFSQVSGTACYLITSPKNNNLTLDNIVNGSVGRPVTIGYVYSNNSFNYVAFSEKYPGWKSHTKNIKFRGGAEAKQALISNSIDIGYSCSPTKAIMKLGGKVLASGYRKNQFNVPSFSTLTHDTNMPDFGFDIELWYNKALDADVKQALITAITSDEFKQSQEKIGWTHNGIGVGRSSEEQFKEVKRGTEFLIPFINN